MYALKGMSKNIRELKPEIKKYREFLSKVKDKYPLPWDETTLQNPDFFKEAKSLGIDLGAKSPSQKGISKLMIFTNYMLYANELDKDEKGPGFEFLNQQLGLDKDPPEGSAKFVANKHIENLAKPEAREALMGIINKDYLTGVWTSGKIFRACSTSDGTNHWFEKDSFIFDFSLIDEKENMVKVLFPGSFWNKDKFDKAFEDASDKLKLLNKEKMELKPGKYRVWFEPNAVADFIGMFNWNGVSESAFRNGSSCLLKMRNSNQKLSPLFSLNESFSSKATAPFNSRGEVSQDVNIIDEGELNNTLVNSKTALEYNVTSNFAEEANSWGMGEYMRSPVMEAGDIAEDDCLTKLGTGIYISNIHYLNWSDVLGGRITGLTRYACYWVEDGKMVAPIKTMRFDDSFYNFFGKNLIGVGKETLARPVIETYDGRNPGETVCPGILVNDFELTL